MPRAGLDPAVVVAAAADLADEVGLANVTMSLLAERLGVRAPSLYKHIDGQADLSRRIAVLAVSELGEALRDALQGRAGRDAWAAAARALRAYVIDHPGRYAATVRLDVDELDEQLTAASTRTMAALASVLNGYQIPPDQTIHALRMLRSLLHGFAMLEVAEGFQLDADVDESFAWLVDFVDRGLRHLSEEAGR